MNDFDDLLCWITTLRDLGVGGEELEESLDALLADTGHPRGLDAIDILRTLYVESDAHRPMVRWALAELDAEVSELEEVGLAA
jgi:hypothetical protein